MKTTILKTTLFTMFYCITLSGIQAADIFWITTSGDWSDGTNWSYDQISSCNCVPTAADDIYINIQADIAITTIAVANSVKANIFFGATIGTITIGDSGNLILITSLLDYSFEIKSNWVVSNYGNVTVENQTFRGVYVNGGIFNNFGSIFANNTVNGIRITSEFNNFGLIQNEECLFGIVCDGSSYFINNGTIQLNSTTANQFSFERALRISFSYFENNGTINIDGWNTGIEFGSQFGGNNPTPGFYNKGDGNINISNVLSYPIYMSIGSVNYDAINELSANITINGNGITQFDLLHLDSPGFQSLGNLTVNP